MANVNLEIQATQLRDGLETLVGVARLPASAVKDLPGSYTDAEARAANIGLASTGNILLDRIGGRTYNEVTPATGSITIDTAGSIIGGVAVIEHNDSVAPSIIITPTNITRNVLNAYVPDVINEIWFLKKADKININYVQPTVVTADTTPPTFTSAPTGVNIASTSFDITATLNENGIVYGYLLANDASAPTVDQVIANAQQNFTDSGSGGTLSFTGLTLATNYDVYVVAVDTAGNKQASNVLVEVLTTSFAFNPSTINAQYVVIDADNVTLDGTRVIVADDLLPTTDYAFEGDVTNGPEISVQNLLNSFNILNTNILRSDSLDSNNFFRSTFGIYCKVKLTDGNPTASGFLCHDQGSTTNTRVYVIVTNTGIIQSFYDNAFQAVVVATTENPVFANGAQSDFCEIAVNFPSNGNMEIWTRLSSGEWINQTLVSGQGDMTVVNMSLYTNTTNKFRVGCNSATGANALNGFYRRFIIQPVKYTLANLNSLSTIDD